MNTLIHNILEEKINGSSLHQLLAGIGQSDHIRYKDQLAFWLQNDKLYPLQSKRDPQREAKKLVDHWLQDVDDKPMVICLVGVCSNFILEALLTKLPYNSHVLVVEPSPENLKSFIENCGSHKIYDKENIHFVTAGSPQDLSNSFRKKISTFGNLCSHIFSLPAVNRFRPELEDTKEVLSRAVKVEAMDRGTNAAFSAEWLQNSIINLPEIINAPGAVKLHNKFKDSDVYVVCAGPSLNDSLEFLKKHQNDALIICVGTALKPLMAAGISPHITIIIDSDPKVSKQFTGIDNPPGYLMCTYTIFPGIVQKYQDKIIAFNCVVTEGFSKWLKTSGINHGTLNVGGTVALSALDLAKITGSTNIFTFGLDLAYSDDGTSHAQNSMYDQEKRITGLVNVQGNRKEKVKTTSQFAGYIDIMNRYLSENFSSFNGNIYNVNDHGAKLAVMELISPEDLPHKITQNSSCSDINELIENQQTTDLHVESLIDQAVDELQDIKNQSKMLLDEFDGNCIPQGIEFFEEKIKTSDVCSNLLDQAMRAWSMQVTNGAEKDPVELTRSFVTQINGSADWVSGLLERSQNRLKQQQGV